MLGISGVISCDGDDIVSVPEYGVFGDIFPRGGALILTDNYPPRPQFAF